MSSEPIYYECVCGYQTYTASYQHCPGCGRDRMTYLIINPGTHPVYPHRLKWAQNRLKEFLSELNLDGVDARRNPSGDYRGRYSFILTRGKHKVQVEIPGIGRQRLDDEWIRLYVDDSSWYWKFALDVARGTLLKGYY